jgi:hypothetical protein
MKPTSPREIKTPVRPPDQNSKMSDLVPLIEKGGQTRIHAGLRIVVIA